MLLLLHKQRRVQIGSRVLSAGYKVDVAELKRLNWPHWQTLCLLLQLADITFILYLLMSLVDSGRPVAGALGTVGALLCYTAW